MGTNKKRNGYFLPRKRGTYKKQRKVLEKRGGGVAPLIESLFKLAKSLFRINFRSVYFDFTRTTYDY